MDVVIRQEQPSDYRETEFLMREAFWNRYSPGCSEHYLLHVMRSSPRFVRELDFVAVAGGRIVGAVVFLESYIEGDDGRRHEVLSLGPVAVHPSCQRQGIGRMLIEHARIVAGGLGYRAILLCGDPDYYTRVGFMPARRWGIRTSADKYFAALHACPLFPGALAGAAGRYHEDDIYDVDAAALDAFDKQFPRKKLITGGPTQRRFEEVLAMQSDYEPIREHVVTSAASGLHRPAERE